MFFFNVEKDEKNQIHSFFVQRIGWSTITNDREVIWGHDIFIYKLELCVLSKTDISP